MPRNSLKTFVLDAIITPIIIMAFCGGIVLVIAAFQENVTASLELLVGATCLFLTFRGIPVVIEESIKASDASDPSWWRKDTKESENDHVDR